MYKKIWLLFFIMNGSYIFASDPETSNQPKKGSIKNLRRTMSSGPAFYAQKPPSPRSMQRIKTDQLNGSQTDGVFAENAHLGRVGIQAYKQREEEADRAAQVFGGCAALCLTAAGCCVYYLCKSK